MIKFHNFIYQNCVYQNIVNFIYKKQLKYLDFNEILIPINNIDFNDIDHEVKLYNIDNNELNIYYLKISDENFIYRLYELLFYIDTIIHISGITKRLKFSLPENIYKNKENKNLKKISELVICKAPDNNINILLNNEVRNDIFNFDCLDNNIVLHIKLYKLFKLIKLYKNDHKIDPDLSYDIENGIIIMAMNEKAKNIVYEIYTNIIVMNCNDKHEYNKKTCMCVYEFNEQILKKFKDENKGFLLVLVYDEKYIEVINLRSYIDIRNDPFTLEELNECILNHSFDINWREY